MEQTPIRPDAEQLNTVLPDPQTPRPQEQEEALSLDAILEEFGGWTKRRLESRAAPASAPEQDAPEPDMQPAPEQPDEPAPEQEQEPEAPQAPEEASAPPVQVPQGDTIRFAPVRTDEEQEPEEHGVWVYKGEPVPDSGTEKPTPEQRREQKHAEQRRRQLERFRKREARRKRRGQEQPEHTFASAEEAARFYAGPSSVRLRLMGAVPAALASAVLLALSTPGLIGGASPDTKLYALLMAALLVLQMVLCADVCRDGITHALRLRFDHISMLVLACICAAADALSALGTGRAPLCTAPTVLLAMALWARSQLFEARRKSLRAACSMQQPVAAVREEKAWHGYDCIFRAPGDAEEFARQLELPDAGQRVMRVYAPVMTGLTFAAAALSSLRMRGSFLHIWTALLLVGYPAGLLLGYARPFAVLAKRLYRLGAAVAGWQGARTLSGEAGLIIEDADLFPPQNVTQGGMKIYVERTVPQIIGYADAVVQTAGSGLAPLFEEMMHDQNGRRCSVDAFRRYEGGGLGAEIGGDVVLMGSLAFMKLMKVRVPEGTRLRQAVYLSINGELAAVFALNYAAAEKIKASLIAVLRSGSLVPVLATRDFMITPQFLKLRYQVPPEYIEFPTVEERARLSTPDRPHEGRQGALMARTSFVSFAEAVVNARRLRRTCRRIMATAIAGGLIGAVSVAFLALLGADQSITGWNVLLYTALWMLPSVLIMIFGMWF